MINFRCEKVFVAYFVCIRLNPLAFEMDNHLVFKKLFKEVGVPTYMIIGGSKSQIEGETRKICGKARCNVAELNKNTPASNCLEISIQNLKNDTNRGMISTNSPLLFW